MAIVYQNIVNDATFATGLARRVSGMAFVATNTGEVDKITVFTNATGHQFKVGIYDNASPISAASLIGSESNLASTVANDFVELTLAVPASLVAGQTYRFALVCSNAAALFGANNAISQSRQNGSTLAAMTDPLPSPWAAAISTSASNRMPYVIMESSQVLISSIDQFIAGEPFEITFNDGAFAATSISVTDGDVTVVVPISDGAGIAPMWNATEECLKFGNVTITATDGVDTTDEFTQTYSIFDDYASVELSSVSLANYRAGTSPSLKVSSLVAYPPEITIDADGGVDSGSTPGTYLVYDRDPDDFICRTYTLNYLTDPPSSEGGTIEQVLRSLGYTGAVPDMFLAWLLDNGATTPSTMDAWKEFLIARGITPPFTIQDGWCRWLRSKGYVGTFNDLTNAFWKDGGII